MKLAFVVPGGFGAGGREHVIPALIDLAGELAARHDIHVFAAGGPGKVTRHSLAGATVHQLGDTIHPDPPGLGRRGRLLARAGTQLWRELRQAASPRRFDAIHGFWANEPGLLAVVAGQLLRVPVVVSVGGGEAVWLPEISYGGAGSITGRTLTRWTLRMAGAITVGSAFARGFLGAATGRAAVIPLGVRFAGLEAEPTRPAGPPFRLLHVGSVNRVKDHATLLTAFAQVAAHHDVTLDCVGQDVSAGEARAHADTLGIAARVHFHGALPRDRLPQLYRSAHLHVVSSRYESQSVALLEAGVAGLPTVGTAVGLLPTLAPDAAAVVPIGEPQALAQAISALLADRPRREAIGRAAQVFARAHDAASTARAFEAIYERLTSCQGPGAPSR